VAPVRFTVAGAAQVKSHGASSAKAPNGRNFLLLPVELRYVNHTASTNSGILICADLYRPPATEGRVVAGSMRAENLHPLASQLRRPNHTRRTNRRDSVPRLPVNPTITADMSNQNPIDHLTDRVTERVERLLLRYEELQRTNALLNEQLAVLTHERDSLKSRLSAARARVDALLERLPENAGSSISHAPAGSE
jgi:cell division protein ZapB